MSDFSVSVTVFVARVISSVDAGSRGGNIDANELRLKDIKSKTEDPNNQHKRDCITRDPIYNWLQTQQIISSISFFTLITFIAP